MPDERDSPPPKVAIIEPGRHGARVRVSAAATGGEAPDDDQPPARRPQAATSDRGEAPTGTIDLPDEEPPHPLLRFSTEELKVELARRQRQVEYLKLQHGALLRQIAELELQISRLSPSGHAPAAGSRRVPRQARATPAENSSSLADAIAAAVPLGASVTPAEAARRVLAAGYKSNARRFGVLVATALGKDARFERVGRGEYRRAR
ncbi:MAG TPA: hypothetical protein VFY71_05000 [Planctomycetota bacterium]|nr:hypothetical protein [Planctomycetota bacterium]